MRPKIASTFWSKFWWVPAFFAFAAVTGLYLHNISEWSIWFDEAFSVALINVPPRELIELTAADVHPPLYYLLLQAWAALFGDSETALRSFSALCMVGAMAVGFGFVRRCFGTKAAYITLPFLLVAPFLLRYGQEARMYALATLICISATYVLVRAEQSKTRPWLWWALYALLVTAGLYTHYYTGLIWIAHWIWHGYVVWHTPGKRFFDKYWVLSYLFVALAFLPWAGILIDQFRHVQNGFWIAPVSHESLINVASNVLMYMQEGHVKNWLSLVLMLALSCLGVLLYKTLQLLKGPQRQHFVLLMAVGFVPVLVLFMLSLPPLQSVFVERYFVPAALSMYLLIGLVIALGPQTKRWIMFKILVATGTIMLLLFGVGNVLRAGNFNYNQNLQPQAKQLMAELNPRLGHNDAIIVHSPYSFYEFDYYDTKDATYFTDPDRIVGSIGSTEVLVGSKYLVKDMASFGADKEIVWLAGIGELGFTVPENWTQLQTIQIGYYKAIGYQIN